jgi:hypothetical protein
MYNYMLSTMFRGKLRDRGSSPFSRCGLLSDDPALGHYALRAGASGPRERPSR